MALPWITGLGIQAREGEAQGAAEGHHAPVSPPLSSRKPQECWVSWLRSLSLASSTDLEGASIRLGVAKAQHPQTHGQIFLPHAALHFPGLTHRRHLDAHYHHQGPWTSSLPSTLRSMNCIPTARILSSFFTPLPRKTRLCEGRLRLRPAPCSRRFPSSTPLFPQAEGRGGEGGSESIPVTPQPTESTLRHPRPVHQLSGSQTSL